jgi:hypothetical protein
MGQNPKVTLHWALHGLEAAISNLGDGPLERRVRRQFHQVLLAVERDAFRVDVTPAPDPEPARAHETKLLG